MQNETTYLFFNLLICGILTSEFYLKVGRSQRTGLGGGLIFIGLVLLLRFKQSRSVIRHNWLLAGTVVVLLVSLTCTGEVLWGELEFKLFLVAILIVVGILSTWTKSKWGNLPPLFWLCLSLGAVAATFALDSKWVDLGAYAGAWAWLIISEVARRMNTSAAHS